MKLSLAAEEVATFYGKMLDHEYTTKEAFQNNFFADWRTQMTKEEKKTIKHLDKCDFTEIHKYFFDRNEERKALPLQQNVLSLWDEFVLSIDRLINTKDQTNTKGASLFDCGGILGILSVEGTWLEEELLSWTTFGHPKVFGFYSTIHEHIVRKLKEEASKLQEEYGYCMLDGHREKIGNFKIEPPGLFRGRGDHPKMGMLKLRIKPKDVIINCSKGSKVPEPPPGHKWKEVRFDNTVTWLASWTENIQGSIKYIMLNPSSKLKGEKDWQKYETARRLKDVVGHIRTQYRADWKSREMKKRQIAVALYFIDKLALRAGNEKEEGETADTVGCCSLRVEHIQLFPELDGQKHVVEFDFLGKDSIRYYNKVPVEKEVFKNLKRFMENKDPEDDLFDRLNTSTLNKHLQDLMDGLTAKVFRTYNASITLQNQLKELTNEEDNVPAKILSYNRANRAVALLCNHQRAPPKTFEKSMQNLQAKIDAKEEQLKEAKKELKRAKADHKQCQNDKTRKYELLMSPPHNAEHRTQGQCTLHPTDQRKGKFYLAVVQASAGASDFQAALRAPRSFCCSFFVVLLGRFAPLPGPEMDCWRTSRGLRLQEPASCALPFTKCKKYGVPIEKIYNKTQRDKFAWAIAMTNEDFEF
ncbi:PREDICTED: DNA topoisomerase I, mitochondrial-like [Nanorana parkeri]|uniref:DNA topoisomerase I, mitochondrial-like n=1 Tax=Nanorana parkeri TaxID=125878 RepID=UPI0008546A14|nr:PREDICTED: DNA topoisomerase I, mitochondrial-like [Nanorana parkeri]